MAHRFAIAVLFALLAGNAHAQVGALAVTVHTPAGTPVADAVVVAVPIDPAGMPPARPRAEQLDQIDKEFVPKVKPVTRSVEPRVGEQAGPKHCRTTGASC